MAKARIKSGSSPYTIELGYDDAEYKRLVTWLTGYKAAREAEVATLKEEISSLLEPAQEALGSIKEFILKIVEVPQKRHELSIKKGEKGKSELILDDKTQAKEDKESAYSDKMQEYDDLAGEINSLVQQLSEEEDPDEQTRIQGEIDEAVNSQLVVGVIIATLESVIAILGEEIDDLEWSITELDSEIKELEAYIAQFGDKKVYGPQLDNLYKQFGSLQEKVTEAVNKKIKMEAKVLAATKRLEYLTTEPVPAKHIQVIDGVYCISGVVANSTGKMVGTLELQGVTEEVGQKIKQAQTNISGNRDKLAELFSQVDSLNSDLYESRVKSDNQTGAINHLRSQIAYLNSLLDPEFMQDQAKVEELQQALWLKERDVDEKNGELYEVLQQKSEKKEEIFDAQLGIATSGGEINNLLGEL